MAEPFTFAGSAEEIEAKLGALNEQAQRRLREATAARKAMSEMSASAESDGGAIRVTVSSAGALTGLELSEAVAGWSPSTISAKVLACVQRAQARLADRAAEVMAEAMPEDGTGAMANVVVEQLRRSFPAPPAGPADEPRRAPSRPTEMDFGPDEDEYDVFKGAR